MRPNEVDALYASWISNCTAMIGSPPRSFSWWKRFRLIATRPKWLRSSDRIHEQFNSQRQLLEEGDVVAGCFVQANKNLFSPNVEDNPAEIVYPKTASTFVRPTELLRIAKEVYQLKGTTPQGSEERRFAESITDEYARPQGLAVPHSIGHGTPCVMSAFIVFRKHLPNRCLRLQIVPLLIHLELPGMTMILPCEFWPDEYRAVWMNSGRER